MGSPGAGADEEEASFEGGPLPALAPNKAAVMDLGVGPGARGGLDVGTGSFSGGGRKAKLELLAESSESHSAPTLASPYLTLGDAASAEVRGAAGGRSEVAS